LKFEFQNISAKPCSLARFFVLGEKILLFYFLKSYFKLFKLLGACLRQVLKAYPTRLKQSVFQRRARI
jgi:hypothetical protein